MNPEKQRSIAPSLLAAGILLVVFGTALRLSDLREAPPTDVIFDDSGTKLPTLFSGIPSNPYGSWILEAMSNNRIEEPTVLERMARWFTVETAHAHHCEEEESDCTGNYMEVTQVECTLWCQVEQYYSSPNGDGSNYDNGYYFTGHDTCCLGLCEEDWCYQD